MNQFGKEILLAVFMGILLPGILLNFTVKWDSVDTPEPMSTTEATIAQTEETAPLRMSLTLPDGSVQQMDMDEYLTGVVLAEMPGSFEVEALKAQAVVARTYTLKAAEGSMKHQSGSVCTQSSCCQAYIDPAAYSGDAEVAEKIKSAVTATSGLVLTYEGTLIEATYFSCSGGSTEDAVAVWGTDYPYLRATDSPGEEHAVHYTDTLTFTASEFAQKLGVSLSGNPASWLGYATYTAGGGVHAMEIGGREYKGTELRSLLGLRSTAFTIKAVEDNITITTRGYGHRVGMSQYGADAMAATGSDYQEILAHYYQGTVLEYYKN